MRHSLTWKILLVLASLVTLHSLAITAAQVSTTLDESIPPGRNVEGDLKTKTFQKQSAAAPNYPTAWLPTPRVARAWEELVTEKPFDP